MNATHTSKNRVVGSRAGVKWIGTVFIVLTLVTLVALTGCSSAGAGPADPADDTTQDGTTSDTDGSMTDGDTEGDAVDTEGDAVRYVDDSISMGETAGSNLLSTDRDLLAYYRMDGDTTDSSGNGNDASLVGDLTAVSDRDGQANGAYDVSQGNLYLDLPNLTSDTSFTIVAWVYDDGTATGSYRALVTKVTDSGYVEFAWRLRNIGAETWRDGSQEAFFNNSGSNGLRTGEQFVSGQWVHVALVYDASNPTTSGQGTARLYENGVEKTSAQVSLSLGDGLVSIGGRSTPKAQSEGEAGMIAVIGERLVPAALVSGDTTSGTDPTTAEPFTGYMDDVAIFGRALTTAEVAGVMDE